MRSDLIKNEVRRLINQRPFRPFVLVMESGEHVPIGHPENIALDPTTNGTGGGASDFYVISGPIRLFSTFEAVSSVAMLTSA